MTNFLHIISHFDGNISINNFELEILANSQFPKTVELNQNIFNLQITPLQNQSSTNLLPILGKLYLTQNPHSPCPFFKIYKLQNNHYYLEITSNFVLTQTTHSLFYRDFGKTKINVLSNNITSVIIEQNALFNNVIINAHTTSVELEEINTLKFIKLYNNNNLHQIICVNSLNAELILNTQANDFEWENDTVKTLQLYNDIFHHGKVVEYTTDNDSIKQTSTYLIYLKPPITKFDNCKLPIAFLDAVNAQNYKLAKSLCSSTLKNKMKNEHLELFFSYNFEIINFQLEQNTFHTIKDEHINSYKFTILNNKIDNISKQ